MSFIPFLTFDGQAEEAMRFYAEVFGADDIQIMRFSDAPPSEGMEPSDRVMYSHIMVGEACVMAYDVPNGMPFTPQESVSVNHPMEDVDEARATFDKLAEGGEVTMPFEATFFSPGFGMCRDRFGTNWMIAVPEQKN